MIIEHSTSNVQHRKTEDGRSHRCVDPCCADGRFVSNRCQTEGYPQGRCCMRMPLMLQIGRIFKRSNETLPLEREVDSGAIARVSAKRTSFFRPWAKRDAAIASLREGMESLAGTIVSIRDNLEK